MLLIKNGLFVPAGGKTGCVPADGKTGCVPVANKEEY